MSSSSDAIASVSTPISRDHRCCDARARHDSPNVIAKRTSANAAVIAKTRVRRCVRRRMIDCTVLEAIYRETLDRCAPERLIAKVWRNDFPRAVVAIGKCAGALRDGIECDIDYDEAFVAIPYGYREPTKPSIVAFGTHPNYSDASFEAGRRLLEFVDRHDDVTFIISGGGSATVEVPIDDNSVEENRRLIESGLTIGEINARRKAMSAIKGGKLAMRVRGRCVTPVYSDVSRGE